VTGVSPAFASRPASWPPADPVSPLDFIIVLVLIPGGLFILIALLSAIPSMARGDSTYQPGLAWRNEPEWFGGPRGGLDKADEPAQLEAGEASERGGASARW
jgi:hypothetical protein